MANEKRLIDANALESQFRTTKIIEVFPEWENLSFQTKHKLAYYGQAVKRIVQNAPTVDAVEVVHGRWVWTETGEQDYEQFWVCSQCGDHTYFLTNYCPNCGAKMDGDGNG